MSLKVALIGYGRMGKAIDALAETYSCDIVERLDIADNADGTGITPDRFNAIDVAIDFSLADAVIPNMKQLGATNTNVVLGTTGWHRDEQKVKDIANETGIGVVHAANFSIGVNLFQAIVEHSAALFADFDDFGAWIHESHHSAKQDTPSGTALALNTAMRSSGYIRNIDVSSTRAGSIPGTHVVGFDGHSETLTLSHTARDRSIFARGALEAAHWIKGRKGWFTMRNVIGLK